VELSDSILNNPYVKNQLIAYIGNKRRLLSFLGEVFAELSGRPDFSGIKNLRFGDCFSGSGSVSRLAKLMGFSVASNDWEFYSKVINTAHIAVSQGEADALFHSEGGIAAVIESLNNSAGPAQSEEYISRHYAPGQTASADYRTERLFYTRENALFIDAVRNNIEAMFPGWDLRGDDYLRKCLLLAPLLYQAATHANTNGVFKAYHKGFGGHGKDALKRIMAPMELQIPLAVPAAEGCEYTVDSVDAADFAAGRVFDICYLDPPYNQHQYGSNYFMLNTIARWDKPPVDPAKTSQGVLKSKAGIRPDWTETRSDYCYTQTAPEELERLLSLIDAKYIVLSYNTEGIIPFDQLFDILSSMGRTEIFCRDYVIYRGGRQSIGRANRNVEFQLVLAKTQQRVRSDRTEVDRILALRSIVSVLNEGFSPARLLERFETGPDGVVYLMANRRAAVPTDYYYRFTGMPDSDELSELSQAELKSLAGNLEYSRCRSKREEAEVLVGLIQNFDFERAPRASSAYRYLWFELLKVVRKFAFRKYSDIFGEVFEEVKSLKTAEESANRPVDWEQINIKTEELGKIAALRFNG